MTTLIAMIAVVLMLAAVNFAAYWLGNDVAGIEELDSAESGRGHDDAHPPGAPSHPARA